MAKAKKKPAPVVESVKNGFENLGVKLGLIRKMTVRDQQELQSDIVNKAQLLRTKMMAIPFSTYERKVEDKERMAQHIRRVAMLANKLERQDVAYILDTREMDDVMFHLCDRMEEAYQLNDMETAEKIIDTLVYGIVTGHKSLLSDEREKAAEIIANREKRLQSYLKMCQISHNAHQHELVIEALVEKLGETQKEFEESDKAAQEYKHNNAQAWEEIENSGAHMSTLKGKALTLAQMLKTTVHNFKEINLLESRIGLENTELLQCKTLLSNIYISLQKANEIAKDEIIGFAKSLNEETMAQINKQINDIIAMDSTLDDFYRAVDAAMSSPAVEKFAAGALDQYEMMKEAIRKEAEANARLLEKEKFQEQDIDAEDSLFQDN